MPDRNYQDEVERLLEEYSIKKEEEALKEIILPKQYQEREYYEQEKRRLFKEWEEQARRMKDPVQVLREEMREELREIKDAISKLGILFDSDAPSEEQMEKHKALREAYLKYKMVEKLILGGEAR